MDDEPEKPPLPLDYDSSKNRTKLSGGPGRGIAGLVGCCCYFGTLGIGYGMLQYFQSPVAVFVPVVLLVIVAIYFHLRLGWRGFAQGAFLGLGLSCLIGVSLCFFRV